MDGLAKGPAVTPPYALQPLDAFAAAQTSVGLVLGAALWLRGLRPRAANLVFLAAIALAVVVPVDLDFLGGIGVVLAPTHVKAMLKMAAAFASLAALRTQRPILASAALAGEAVLWRITDFVTDSDLELAAAHLAFFGLLVGIHWRTLPATATPATTSEVSPAHDAWRDDVAAFLLGTSAGAVANIVLLHGWTDSGDEWANTFQAAVFAKMHAFASVPRCAEAFRSFWVFQYMGRSFAQYTPGWPYFMALFVWLHAPWLAGPASLGLLAAGVSRLGRRAASGFSPGTAPPPREQVRAAGRFAALMILLSSTMLINGASRYPHVFVAATFAWSIEGLFAIATPGLSTRWQWGWGVVLGASASLMLATRPGDGATLGVGLLVYFIYAFVRRRLAWRSILGAGIVAGAVGGLTLVILRLQLGKWLATGYSISQTFYPWVKFVRSVPKANELKWVFPLASGAYCWWPCAPAVGLAGLAALRGRAQRMGFVFFFSFVPFFLFYALLEMGRGSPMGYGPRYELPVVAPMAVGGGVILARLWHAARTRCTSELALDVGGPACLALTAVLLGVVRLAPLVYPPVHTEILVHNRLQEALTHVRLHNAIVFASDGLNNTDPMDLTENLPLDLYPDQDVLIAIDRGPDVVRCVREQYPKRSFYHAIPSSPVRFVPF